MSTHNRPKRSHRSLDFIRALIEPELAPPHPYSRRERLAHFLTALTIPGCILIAIAWLISIVALITLGREHPLRGTALIGIAIIAITMILPGALVKNPTTTIFAGTILVLGLLPSYGFTLIDERAHNGITTLVVGLAFIYLSKLDEEQSNAQKQPHSRRFFLSFICGIACIAVGILAVAYYNQAPNRFIEFIHLLADMHILWLFVAVRFIPSQSADKA
jgi:hypothetical protein